MITPQGGKLKVSNLGSSGCDGVSISLGDPIEGFSADVELFQPGAPPFGALFTLRSVTADAIYVRDLILEDGITLDLSSTISSFAGSRSAWCAYRLVTPTGDDFEAWLDGLFVMEDAAIFSDGFESGDTSAWSSSVTN